MLLLILGERSVFTTFAKPFFSPWLPYRISSLWRFVLLPSDHIYHILCASILVSGKWTASRSSYPFSNLIWVNFFLYASHLVTKAGWWKFSYAFTTAFIAAAFSVSLIYMHENCSFVAVGRKAVWRIYCLCNLHSNLTDNSGPAIEDFLLCHSPSGALIKDPLVTDTSVPSCTQCPASIPSHNTAVVLSRNCNKSRDPLIVLTFPKHFEFLNLGF